MQHQRPWLASYPPGVPALIDADAFPSIVAALASSIERYRERPAFANLGRTLSYGGLDTLSRDFAGYLSGVLGLQRGERLAIMLPNCLQYPIATFGALRAGLTVVNTNPMYTPRELRHQLADSGATAILVLDNFGHVLQEVLPDTSVRHVITSGLGDMLGFPKGALVNFALKHLKKMVPAYKIEGAVRFRDALAAGADRPAPDLAIQPSDIAFLQYTGGTTGVAKGAMLTHRNLVANMQQAAAWIGGNVRPGQEIVITALPLYHVFALTANSLVFMKFGGLNCLITDPRDMRGFVRTLRRTRFTAITGVNTLFNALLDAPGFDQLDFSALHITLGGGMAVQRNVAQRWKQVTGCTLIEAYGLTETAPAVCINPLDLGDYNGSIGLPLPSTDVCIMDEDRAMLATGQAGELCIRGPQVMAGYWARPHDTAQAINADGWLHTGDIARMDASGFFYLIDRKKDMILVSGFNVYPNEIEEVISMLPGVREVVAIGIADAKSGEAVKLVVVRNDPSLSAEQIRAHAREHLTGYKQPRVIEFRDALPKSNVGKILRRELRDGVSG